MAIRCEGWRRTGGAFTLGPVKWEQCSNDAIVNLTVRQKGEEQTFPSCHTCWLEAVERAIPVLRATPLPIDKPAEEGT